VPKTWPILIVAVDSVAPTIRAATSADAEQIADVHVRAWQWAYRGQVPDTFLASLSVPGRTDVWRRWLDDPDGSCIWVAEIEGRIVGFVSAGRCRDEDAEPGTGEVYAIYIEADRLDTGLGRRLIQTATRWLRTSSFSCATLWVLDSNDRARRFYEKAGWVRDGATKVDDREGFSLHEIRYRTIFD
jgi:GNAT superfamily N-acetyltransferase